jgi:hypothetical protein
MNPPAKKRLPVAPEDWLTHAFSDLKMTRLGNENKEILAEQTCFHASRRLRNRSKRFYFFLGLIFH